MPSLDELFEKQMKYYTLLGVLRWEFASVYIRKKLFSRKQTFKKAFETNGSPRHLNIVSDFRYVFFSLFHKLKQFINLKWLLNILYHVSHSYLVISSHIKH